MGIYFAKENELGKQEMEMGRETKRRQKCRNYRKDDWEDEEGSDKEKANRKTGKERGRKG